MLSSTMLLEICFKYISIVIDELSSKLSSNGHTPDANGLNLSLSEQLSHLMQIHNLENGGVFKEMFVKKILL